jgi:Tfp pilus assembly protein PilX
MTIRKESVMHTQSERGIALVLALFLMTALSVLGASLMFLSQTETYASMNYRMMSQARYAAEAGVNKAANFLLDGVQYIVPDAVTMDAQFDVSKSPVVSKANNQPVVLVAGTWTGAGAPVANYPTAGVTTAFAAAAQGTMAADNQQLTYKVYATLVSMQKFVSYGGTTDVVQTWELTSDGGFVNSSRASVRVTATAERPRVPANPYAAFATANVCDSMLLKGNVKTDSYDSSVGPPTGAGNSTEASGGDVGTNGNLHVEGSVDINGNLYTPREGVGSCTAGSVTGLSGTCDPSDPTCVGSSIQSMVHLPKAVMFPIPTFSTVPGTNTVTVNAATLGSTPVTAAAVCASFVPPLVFGTNCDLQTSTGASAFGGALPAAGQTYTKLVVGGTGADVTLPNMVVSNGFEMIINGSSSPSQKVNINSLNVDGDLTFQYPNNDASVIMQFAGNGLDPTVAPFALSDLGTWKQNKPYPGGTGWDASALQIVYGGTAHLEMSGGNSQSAATIYAPNASFTLKGTQDFYGSILAKTVENNGNPGIHYDRRLSRQFWVAGQPMMGTFTWQRAQ